MNKGTILPSTSTIMDQSTPFSPSCYLQQNQSIHHLKHEWSHLLLYHCHWTYIEAIQRESHPTCHIGIIKSYTNWNAKQKHLIIRLSHVSIVVKIYITEITPTKSVKPIQISISQKVYQVNLTSSMYPIYNLQ